MLSSVLRSERAVRVNIEIMRAFVRLRNMLAKNATPARRLEALERKYDEQFRIVFEAIQELMTPAATIETKKIGFWSERGWGTLRNGEGAGPAGFKFASAQSASNGRHTNPPWDLSQRCLAASSPGAWRFAEPA